MSDQAADPAARLADLRRIHREVTERRDAAPVGSDEFVAAAQEVARIEVEINGLVELLSARPEEPARRW